MPPRNVVVVDDDRGFLRKVRETFEMCGFNSLAFSDGEAAGEAVCKVMPDAMLMDLRKDHMDDFAVSKMLKADPATAGIPIIAMGGYFPGEEYSQVREICGMFFCLSKPFNAKQMLDCIRTALEIKDAEKRIRNRSRFPPGDVQNARGAGSIRPTRTRRRQRGPARLQGGYHEREND